MVSFELGKEIEKYFFRLVTSVGQRKNSAFPGGKGSDALQLSHSDSKQVPLRSLYNIRPAYCWDQRGVPCSWQDEKHLLLRCINFSS